MSRNAVAPFSCLPGLRLGHAEDFGAATGVSALLFDRPVTAAISVLGGAPGGRETGLLAPEMTVECIDALVLSGGSAFGLDAAGGVMRHLAAQGRGLAVGSARVPIVPQAIIFDLLNGGDKSAIDYGALGALAAAAAGERIALGSLGAGTGATTATLKGGFGAAEGVTRQGFRVQAFVVVNAIGTACLPDGSFWAAPFERNGEFGALALPHPLPEQALCLRIKGHAAEPATTIGAIVTDAALSKAQATRLAIMAQDGLARALRPAHAPMDGDTLFAAATGARPLGDALLELTELGMLAGDCVARAIALGVYHAQALPFPGALPDWLSHYSPKT